MNGGMAQLRISGMSELAARGKFVTKSAFAAEGEAIFRGLAIDEEPRTAWSGSGGFGANAVALLADDKQQRKVARAAVQQRFGGGDHRGDDALGVARAAAVDMRGVFAGGKERRDRVHVRRKRDDGLAESDEKVIAIGRGGLALDLGVVTRGQRRKMREEILGHRLFLAGGRIEINERARQCEQIHAYLILSGRSEKKGRKHEDVLGLPPLDSAPPDFRMTVTWP